MKNDIYEEVRVLTHELENTGNDDLIQNALDAINFSATSTEALLKIKFHLSQGNKINLNEHTLNRINSIKDKIDKLLD